MSVRPVVLLAVLLMAGCGQPAHVYAPPPGGHDALSQPPADLTK